MPAAVSGALLKGVVLDAAAARKMARDAAFRASPEYALWRPPVGALAERLDGECVRPYAAPVGSQVVLFCEMSTLAIPAHRDPSE
ncbi:MAG: hypothetical protein ACRDN0_34580 [Trebonia sp.]